MHDKDSLCVTIDKAGEYALVLNAARAELRFIPMSIAGGGLACFVPVAGATTLKFYARKAPIVLRFQKSDLAGAELKSYSIFDESNIVRRRALAELWQFPPSRNFKLKLVAMKSKIRWSELAAQLRSARDNEWGPLTAFAADNPEVITGWPERTADQRSLAHVEGDPSVVVALHLNDAAAWPVFERHLDLFPFPFRLCVTTPVALPAAVAARINVRFPGTRIVEAGRQGGAIAGFLDLLYHGAFDGDVIICRVNDGSSIGAGDANGRLWQMRASLISLLGSASQIEAGISMLRSLPDFGMIGPALMRRASRMTVPGESEAIEHVVLRDVLARIGLRSLARTLEYFAGGNFWLRGSALASLREPGLRSAR